MGQINYDGVERRRFRRIKVGVTVVYRKEEPPDVRIRTAHGEHVGSMVDISVGGMAIVTDVAIPPVDHLRIRFTLSEIEDKSVNFYGDVELLGQVRSCVPCEGQMFRVGIAFVNIDERNRFDIANFVNVVEKRLPEKEQ
ncbi:MAG TPA: PilZ domain-containing protein [Candidatus Omnitrophota bacterium]|nr:PilZ domain-containing protein [Candidatus Omnitrophota bacterium]HPT07314.1 PilZ domain-containing protein [Candidatus Omnitrophota bacterium]